MSPMPQILQPRTNSSTSCRGGSPHKYNIIIYLNIIILYLFGEPPRHEVEEFVLGGKIWGIGDISNALLIYVHSWTNYIVSHVCWCPSWWLGQSQLDLYPLCQKARYTLRSLSLWQIHHPPQRQTVEGWVHPKSQQSLKNYQRLKFRTKIHYYTSIFQKEDFLCIILWIVECVQNIKFDIFGKYIPLRHLSGSLASQNV